MRILIACEFSGIVRDSFRRKGHEAISCDLLMSERPGPHVREDVLELIKREPFDMMIAFPPCTFLCLAGARYNAKSIRRWVLQQQALEFVLKLMAAPIERIAIENPVGAISSHIRRPDQIINPYWFGHVQMKKTCLWLKNLPLLRSTLVVERRVKFEEFTNGWKNRSRTFQGVADAMAAQWG